MTTKKERISLFIKGLNYELQVLFVHITSASRSFNKVIEFVMKVEEVGRDCKAKVLSKKAKNSGSFQGYYSSGSGWTTLVAKVIQSVMPSCTCNNSGTIIHKLIKDRDVVTRSTGSRPSFDHTCYDGGDTLKNRNNVRNYA